MPEPTRPTAAAATIREVSSDADLATLAALVDVITPDDPTSVNEMRWADETYPGNRRFLAEVGGRPVGCATQTGMTSEGEFSIPVGVSFDDAKGVRGRASPMRAVSTCPDEACCRRPSNDLSTRWNGKAWPSARVHMQMFSPLPRGAVPGDDDNEAYAVHARHVRRLGRERVLRGDDAAAAL